jgi:hypothetical protein
MESENLVIKFFTVARHNLNLTMKITTLCYFVDRTNDRILLALKKRGLGAGKLNGPGNVKRNL